MTNKKKKPYIQLLRQFVKLQIAGNIPFWGTYLGFLFFDQVLHLHELASLAAATILANFLFFIVDARWVFGSGSRKAGKNGTRAEIFKFVIFIAFSALLNLVLVRVLSLYVGITPYMGLFITAAFFTLWMFVGLRFWVFSSSKSHKPTAKPYKGKV